MPYGGCPWILHEGVYEIFLVGYSALTDVLTLDLSFLGSMGLYRISSGLFLMQGEQMKLPERRLSSQPYRSGSFSVRTAIQDCAETETRSLVQGKGMDSVSDRFWYIIKQGCQLIKVF